MQYDVCIVGSGAGAGPVIYELANAGYKVLVLEKGPWFKTEDFTKDEMVAARRSVYTPDLKHEQHVLVEKNEKGDWVKTPTLKSGNDFWNGNCVGGSSNFMSAYFHRLKPIDFKLLSEFGAIEGANIADWPINYQDLEPYYAKAEHLIGVSGKVVEHSFLEPRSTADYPYPPLAENIFAKRLDKAAAELGYELFPTARGILSRAKDDRKACYYSGYCGSYGCSSNAKGSSRAALLQTAIASGNCEIKPNAKVFHLQTNGKGAITHAHFYIVRMMA